jgi:hypothetical protein
MRINPIEMTVQSQQRSERLSFPIGSVSGARYAGRDVEATRRELDEILARDKHFTMATHTNPSIFHIGRYLLTQGFEFEVQGPLTGGEAEVVVIRLGDQLYITAGSDQCDRELDSLFPDKPKQMCPHPIAAVAWPYDEVREHWDSLRISSHVVSGSYTVPLQDSALSELVDLEYLLAMDAVQRLADPMILYCGSVEFLESAAETVEDNELPEGTARGVGDEFHFRLHDPVLERTINHRYRAKPLGDELEERRDALGLAMYHPGRP